MRELRRRQRYKSTEPAEYIPSTLDAHICNQSLDLRPKSQNYYVSSRPMDFIPSQTGLALAAIVIALYCFYKAGLPKPIPGIPHNEDSAQRFMGDVPHLLALQKAGKRPRQFWADLCIKKSSPIAQFFPGPFHKPIVVISDFREAQDLLIRRSSEIDKGGLIRMMWSGLVPTHFVGRDTKDPVTIESKALVKDIMGPKYIATVSSRLPVPDSSLCSHFLGLYSGNL